VSVLVHVLERLLVDVLVGVALGAVLMGMCDVGMLVAGVRVTVRLGVVLVLVLVVVGHFVVVFDGHGVASLAFVAWSRELDVDWPSGSPCAAT
jgi:hypothetical protein